MSSQASDLAQRLARDAEAVCRHYLSNGRRIGAKLVIVQWQNGEPVWVYPPENATAKPIWPKA